MQEVYEFIDSNWREAIEDLKRFCAQPSISAQKVGIEEAASFAAQLLQEYGIKSRILNSTGNPVVYGELEGDSHFTLLFYNHYDVQPPEPLELWTTPPFQPEEKNGKLIGRGVSDDKGEIIARLLAIKSFLKSEKGRLPISIKFLIEGGEEIGSPDLPSFIHQNRDLLSSNACIWESGRVSWEGKPELELGVKGIVAVELEVQGAVRDTHSSMGTILPNPAWRLIWALNSIKDSNENILIEGFYNDVRAPKEEEIEAIKRMPLKDEELGKNLGIKGFLKGLSGVELMMRHLLEPSCTINGFISGYTGEGSKTVLPSRAQAKLDFRLVPDQEPQDIISKIRRHLDKKGFTDVAVNAKEGENPARTPLNSPFVKLVGEAAREVYGLEPIIKPTAAGSGPMFSFIETLKLPVVSVGIGHPDSRAHAPDENIRFVDFIRGAKHIAAILNRCSKEK